MTEQEWLKCTEPEKLLGFLRRRKRIKPSTRKQRLFACACVRRVWNQLTDHRSRNAIEVAERYADRRAKAKDLDNAYYAACDAMNQATTEINQMDSTQVTLEVMECASSLNAAASTAARDLVNGVIVVIRFLSGTVFSNGGDRPISTLIVLKEQANLLRDIFGNPLRPTKINRSWLKWNGGIVVKIAQAIYEERTFDRLPILATALEEAGCNDAEILAHLRETGPHVRGCWALDLVLGKE